MAVLWDVAPSSLIEIDYVSDVHAALIIRAVGMSEMVSFLETVWCSVPEDSHLQLSLL